MTQITKNYENVSSEGIALTLLVSCRIFDISNGGKLSKLISYKINRNVHNFHGIYLFILRKAEDIKYKYVPLYSSRWL